MAGRLAVVTDSTACLSAELAPQLGVTVVPLRIVAGGLAADDGPGVLDGPLGGELRRGQRLSTARPGPAKFAAAYAAAAGSGAAAVVSVHLSGQLSGTVRSAQLAAAGAALPVHVVDSLSIGMGLGFGVLAAARSAQDGQAAGAVAAAASRCAARLGSYFALDSPDYLQAGGRLEPPGVAAGHHGGGPELPGGRRVLTSRPLLHVRGGRITVLERVRTARRPRPGWRSWRPSSPRAAPSTWPSSTSGMPSAPLSCPDGWPRRSLPLRPAGLPRPAPRSWRIPDPACWAS